MASAARGDLAEQVLPLIRTRRELYRRRDANEHGVQMHAAVDILEQAAAHAEPAEFLKVTQQAIASAMKVIARADDSSGIIGDACRRLLRLHPIAAAEAKPPPAKLVAWMIAFQFNDEVDYFTIDPVAYAPALGTKGIDEYRRKLDEITSRLGPRPAKDDDRPNPHWHEWFVLDWNAQRLAVHDRDFDAIIRTHARDRRVAAWLQDTAKAFEEIGEIGLAIDWARQAAEFDSGHQAQRAADYWARLLAEYRPQEVLPTRLAAFERWPSSSTAAQLHAAAGASWPQYVDLVMQRLTSSPRDAVLFTLLTLKDVPQAWQLAHALDLHAKDTWELLATAYEQIDAIAVLPVLQDLVHSDLAVTDAKTYQVAAERLARMRLIAAGTDHAAAIDAHIAELREVNRRRPRLQREFDRARLP